MTKRTNTTKDEFDDEVIKVYQLTTPEERRQIAQDWCMGTRYWPDIEARGLLPIALKVASLIEVDHPLLVTATQFKFGSLLAASAFVLQVQMEADEKHTHIPTPWVQTELERFMTEKLSTDR